MLGGSDRVAARHITEVARDVQMSNFKSFAIAAVACVLVAGSLSAQTVTGQVQWAGVNGAWSSYSDNGVSAQWNVYTSPYQAQFWIPSNTGPSPLLPPSGVSGFGPVSDIFCVDFNHYAITSTYDAYFTNLGSSTAGDLTQHTRAGNLGVYLAAAYLAQAIDSVGVNTAAAGDMNGAIWQIMSGTVSPEYRWNGSSWDASGINTWVGNAVAAAEAGKVDPYDWVVVTDQAGVGQEYLTQVTPEPATLLLLGTGLMGMLLGAAALRRPTA